MSIWLPPGCSVPRVGLPDEDLRLPDGRVLKRLKDYEPADAHVWQTANGLRVLASMDDVPSHGELLHVSVSYASRDPSWSEIRAIRDLFYPSTLDAMMVLPRAEDYVNLHPHTFHLWQTPTVWGIM